MPYWVVEEWNFHESSHSYSSCQVTWGFCNNYQNKPYLNPHLILSNRSKWICLPDGEIWTAHGGC
jgi:hypothetical protein